MLNNPKEDFAYDCMCEIRFGGRSSRLRGVLGQDLKLPQYFKYSPVAELVYAADLKSVLIILRGVGSNPIRATSGNISSLHVVPLE